MANENFKVSDTVERRSDGQKMRVVAVDGDRVRCEWSDQGVAHSQWFRAADLRKA
jgi:uncharacterized protein YodC (DUF2158 family)